jgi:alpha-beta hydrolase superfamily lysophospholipase
MWRKDLGRSIDYLESRADIDHNKLCYFGSSFGSLIGVGLLAIEKRFKIAVLRLVGFSYKLNIHPEINEIDYASRIKIPILVLNGKYDMIFPYETSQVPMFEAFGTPKEHKRMVMFDVGHSSPKPRSKYIKEVLDWLDRYLGPVKKK